VNIFFFHPVTHEFNGAGMADQNPRAEGEWILPGSSTTHEPPSTTEHQIAVFNNGSWGVEVDYRGYTYWLDDGTKTTIEVLGIQPPPEALDAPPPPPLGDQKLALIEQLKLETRKQIEAGYTSDALGTTHTYPSDGDYQTNILGAKLAGVDMPFMCADESDNWDRRHHTAAELAQVFTDGVAKKSAILDAKDVIAAAVMDAPDQGALDAIDITQGWPE
jgi:hypothetical protein